MKNNTDYTIFRTNLIKMRAVNMVSAKELNGKLGFKSAKRILDIEEGRGLPSLKEVCDICKFFNHNIDNMLYKEATIKVEFDGKQD